MTSPVAAPLAFEDRGAGPAVVLLHGQPGTAESWDPVAACLEHDARVIVPDRPGYGRSPDAPGGLEANADAVVALLDRLSVERATLVGHSLGGGIALAAAERHASRVAGLILVSSIGTRSAIEPIDRLLAAPIVGPATVYAGFRVARRVISVGWLLRRLVPEIDRVDPDAAERVLAPFRGPRVWRTFAVEQRALARETPDLEGRLSAIDVPTTVLVGDRDDFVAPSVGIELAQRIPGARLQIVRDAGHLLFLERPEVVATAVCEQLHAVGEPAT